MADATPPHMAAEEQMEAREMAMAMAIAPVLKLYVANVYPNRREETPPEVLTRCSFVAADICFEGATPKLVLWHVTSGPLQSKEEWNFVKKAFDEAMAEFTTAQGEYVWCAKTLELLCTELLQSEPTEVTVTLAAPDVNHPVSTCMYPGKVYEFLDADREGVGCSPPQLGHPDEDLDDEAPDDEAAWHLWYLTFVVHVSPTVSPALDTEQTAWGNFVDGWDKKDDEDEKDDGDDDAEDNEEDDGENEQDGDGFVQPIASTPVYALLQSQGKTPMSINPDVEINGGDLMGVACTVTSARPNMQHCSGVQVGSTRRDGVRGRTGHAWRVWRRTRKWRGRSTPAHVPLVSTLHFLLLRNAVSRAGAVFF